MDRYDGYVALVDVLGFSNLVSREGSGGDLGRYIECVQQAAKTAAPKEVEYVLFSDTVILTVPNAESASLLALCESCSTLFGILLSNEIPIRGAIAHGSFFRSRGENGVFLAGRPIVEAYHFERRQDWIGIALEPSVIRKNPELPARCRLPRREDRRRSGDIHWMVHVQPASIPFQADQHVGTSAWSGLAIVPISPGARPQDVPTFLAQCRRHLEKISAVAPDPRSQGKAEATKVWLHQVWSTWQASGTWSAE